MRDKIGLKGHFLIRVLDAEGIEIDREFILANTVPDAGENMLCALFVSGSTRVTHMSCGTGQVSGDDATDLQYPLGRVAFSTALAQSAPSDDNEATAEATFSGATYENEDITEYGVFIAISGDSMYCFGTGSAKVLGTGQSLVVTWTFIFGNDRG